MSGIVSTSTQDVRVPHTLGAPTASDQASPNTTYEFASIKGSSPYFSNVEAIFREHITPLYGDQSAALKKIGDRIDRRCELLLQNNSHVVGLIVYKTDPQQEYNKEGLVDSFEVKSLFAMGSDRKSQKEHRVMLLNRVLKLAQRKFCKSVHLTMSERSQDLLDFFTKRGFSIGATWQDRYLQGVK